MGNLTTFFVSAFRVSVSRSFAVVVLLLFGLAFSTVQASPPAGTRIDNQARVSFIDSGGRTAIGVSNTVSVVVQQIASFTLTANGAKFAAPGGEVSYPHILTNTGNGPDRFDLTVVNLGGDQFDLTGLTLFTDADCNGAADAQPVTNPVSLNAGASFCFVAVGSVPTSGVVAGNQSLISVSAVGNATAATAGGYTAAGTQTNTDTTTVTGNAVIRVTKAIDQSSGASPSGPYTYTLTYTNAGSGTATNVTFTDVIPVGTTYVAGSGRWSVTGVTTLTDANNTDAQGSNPTIVYDFGVTSGNTVTAVINSIPAGASGFITFQVNVNSGLSPQTINNTAQFRYDPDGAGTAPPTSNENTNTVGLAVSAPPPTLSYYTDNTYGSIAFVSRLGDPLFVQGNALACNLDPNAVESVPITIGSQLTGDVETYISTETAANSGIFRIQPNVPTRGGVAIPGNGIIETAPNDRLTATMLGCGAASTQTTILIDPNGVVFDSQTNALIAGATVTLIDAATGLPATVFQADGVTPAPSTVVTGLDGRYEFPVVAPGTYRLLVVPPAGYSGPSVVPPGSLPPGRAIDPSGSYGGNFIIPVGSSTVQIDTPLDPATASGFFIQKIGSRTLAEIGDFVDYQLTIRNNTGGPLINVSITDNLPAGFAYQTNTARLDGVAIANPAGGAGPQLVFNIGNLANGAQVILSYRVKLGPGALQGDGINRAQGTSGAVLSNVASFEVRLQEGVFSPRGFILGKIYGDCNKNAVQDAGELGVPAVRIYLEDGTYVISDSEGKYSFIGISPRTHVLKVDKTTLPGGAELLILANRNAFNAGSRFVDLKRGETHKADFAIACTPAVLDDIKARRAKSEVVVAEIERGLNTRLTPDGQPEQIGDVRALPANGVIGTDGRPTTQSFTPVLPEGTLNSGNSVLPGTPAQATPSVNLEKLLLNIADNSLGFIDLKDKDTLPIAQTAVRVKGVAGAGFKLTVNGQEVPKGRVGKKSVLAEKQLEAWEYIGVSLRPGENILEISQTDSFGNARGSVKITVIAPDKLGKLSIVLPKEAVPADGHTPATVTVRLTDDKGVLVTARTPVTLETTLGRWQADDLDKVEPGLQVFVEGGSADFTLLPPQEPGEASIRALSGVLKGDAKLTFLPDLRPLIAVGVIEGTLNLSKLDTTKLVPSRAQDGFEEELKDFSTGNGKDSAAGRAAFFLKGKIKGEYLLTLAYDSEKQTQERLFRDIQPDEFYPVYGDSSIHGFDAQSTSRLYVRVDKNKSYLLYGDYTTQSTGEARSLGQYQRSLTGVKEHYESGKLSINAFASHDNNRQVIDEIRAQGISGPYTLTNSTDVLPNSERVEILTRDRNQPSVILKTVPQTRFADYEFEPFSGIILFRAPVPSLDENLNPISIRVTYEVEQGGKNFLVAGVDGQVKITDNVEVGGSYVKDNNPQDQYSLTGINTTVKLGEKTFLIGEVAHSEKDSIGKGNAERFELRHEGEKVQARIYAGHTDEDFNNPSGVLSDGRSEAGAKITYKVDPQTNLNAEAIRSEDVKTDGRRDGVLLSAQHTFDNNVQLELGVRHSRETTAPAQSTSVGTTPNEFTTVRGRLGWQLPNLPQANVYGEYEQDIEDSDRQVAALGGEYQFANHGRLYARHEFISSLGSAFALNTSQAQNTTVIGLDTDYSKDAHLFSEFRGRDAFSGRETEAAIGTRNVWHLAEGLNFSTSAERIKVLEGSKTNDANAWTGAIEYTADPLWKGTARLEYRTAQTSDSILNTLGLARKLDQDWTFLGKNIFAMSNGKGGSVGDKTQERLQLGVAYRDTDTNIWNGLARYEYRYEKDDTLSTFTSQRAAHIFSTNVNYQPNRQTIVSGQYAVKFVDENSNGISTTTNAQLLNLRLNYDINDHWDAGVSASTLFSDGFSSQQYGVGAELGYLVRENLWVSAGYNFFGFEDKDLTSESYTNPGFYLRLRYKFDEDLFGGNK